jgi:hypothetical protein
MKETVGGIAHREDMDNREETGDSSKVDMVSRKITVNRIEVMVVTDNSKADMAGMVNMAEIVDNKVVSAGTVVTDREDTENRAVITRAIKAETGASAEVGTDNRADMAVQVVVTEINAATGATRAVIGVTRVATGDKAIRATGATRVVMVSRAVLADMADQETARKMNMAIMEEARVMVNGLKKIMTTMTIATAPG